MKKKTNIQIAEENFIVNRCAQRARLKKVHRVQVGNVHASLVRLLTAGPILLHVQPEKAHLVGSARLRVFNHFKSEHCL